MLKKFLSGISAGVLISIGGCVYLSCENRYIGAVLFSVALICICMKGYSLYTGKIGFIPADHSADAVSGLLLGLAGNAASVTVSGVLLSFAIPDIASAAAEACAAKLTQQLLQTAVRAFFCGILMYLAVSIYREKNTAVGIIFCIPVFILSGFEHSIADMFYFSAAGAFGFREALFILIVVLGNTFGAMLLPLLNWGKKKNAE